MASDPSAIRHGVRYEADERPSVPLTIGLGLQYTVLSIAGVVLIPAVLITIAGTCGGAGQPAWSRVICNLGGGR